MRRPTGETSNGFDVHLSTDVGPEDIPNAFDRWVEIIWSFRGGDLIARPTSPKTDLIQGGLYVLKHGVLTGVSDRFEECNFFLLARWRLRVLPDKARRRPFGGISEPVNLSFEKVDEHGSTASGGRAGSAYFAACMSDSSFDRDSATASFPQTVEQFSVQSPGGSRRPCRACGSAWCYSVTFGGGLVRRPVGGRTSRTGHRRAGDAGDNQNIQTRRIAAQSRPRRNHIDEASAGNPRPTRRPQAIPSRRSRRKSSKVPKSPTPSLEGWLRFVCLNRQSSLPPNENESFRAGYFGSRRAGRSFEGHAAPALRYDGGGEQGPATQ